MPSELSLSINLSAKAYFRSDAFTLAPSISDKGYKLSQAQEFVIQFLSSHLEATIEDIMDNTSTCSPETARRAVYSLAGDKMGFVKRADSNNLGRGKKAAYALTQKGTEYAEQRL